eukprot:Rhum_TRINITY_DN15056_c3_g2::Rhum_TRINITY_DN15056_c3_g2_i1::g.135310::m.135310
MSEREDVGPCEPSSDTTPTPTLPTPPPPPLPAWMCVSRLSDPLCAIPMTPLREPTADRPPTGAVSTLRSCMVAESSCPSPCDSRICVTAFRFSFSSPTSLPSSDASTPPPTSHAAAAACWLTRANSSRDVRSWCSRRRTSSRRSATRAASTPFSFCSAASRSSVALCARVSASRLFESARLHDSRLATQRSDPMDCAWLGALPDEVDERPLDDDSSPELTLVTSRLRRLVAAKARGCGGSEEAGAAAAYVEMGRTSGLTSSAMEVLSRPRSQVMSTSRIMGWTSAIFFGALLGSMKYRYCS